MQLPQVEMNVFETILARRSVRSFSEKEVAYKSIMVLLAGAVRAPTARHAEQCAFVIIQDKALLKNLSDLAKPILMERMGIGGSDLHTTHFPDSNLFYDAGTLIIICTKSTETFAVADCWLAAENLMLAACAMRLGTCVIGAALPAMNMPEIKPEIGIPDLYEAIVPIILGWPKENGNPSSRKAPHVLNMIPALAH